MFIEFLNDEGDFRQNYVELYSFIASVDLSWTASFHVEIW